MTGDPIRKEYPFQLNYYDSRLDRCLVVLRAESADALAEAYLQLQAALDGALGEAPDPQAPADAAAPPAQTPSSPAQTSDSVPSLPVEALAALMEQSKKVPCDCKAGWWDNRVGKRSPKYPDFKCTKCGKGVWLTAYQGES
jgi:hypothetical protein